MRFIIIGLVIYFLRILVKSISSNSSSKNEYRPHSERSYTNSTTINTSVSKAEPQQPKIEKITSPTINSAQKNISQKVEEKSLIGEPLYSQTLGLWLKISDYSETESYITAIDDNGSKHIFELHDILDDNQFKMWSSTRNTLLKFKTNNITNSTTSVYVKTSNTNVNIDTSNVKSSASLNKTELTRSKIEEKPSIESLIGQPLYNQSLGLWLKISDYSEAESYVTTIDDNGSKHVFELLDILDTKQFNMGSSVRNTLLKFKSNDVTNSTTGSDVKSSNVNLYKDTSSAKKEACDDLIAIIDAQIWRQHHNHFEGFLHYTAYNNLSNIINEEKLFSRSAMEQNAVSYYNSADMDVVHQTSSHVKNGTRFYYYYNTPTSYMFQKNNPSVSYIVLVFNHSLIYSKNVSFFEKNAARGDGYNSETKDAKHASLCFDWYEIIQRGPHSSGDTEKTGYRNAEMICYDPVELTYLKAIYFRDKSTYDIAKKTYANNPISKLFKYDFLGKRFYS